MTKLEPPDLQMCQAEMTGAFMFGPGYARCTSVPIVVVQQTQPGPDGQRGSMSLCASCLAVFDTEHQDDPNFNTEDPIIPAHRPHKLE